MALIGNKYGSILNVRVKAAYDKPTANIILNGKTDTISSSGSGSPHVED
jgi:hypothetical protein